MSLDVTLPDPHWCVEHTGPDPDPMGSRGWLHHSAITSMPALGEHLAPTGDEILDTCRLQLIAFDSDDGERELQMAVALLGQKHPATLRLDEARHLAQAILDLADTTEKPLVPHDTEQSTHSR